MKNLIIDAGTATDIDERVEKIHRDIGHRAGRIELVDIRDLLRLDLAYYSADNVDFLNEVVHRMKVGARQVIKRPMRLLAAVRKLGLRALFIPGRKQILIDEELPDLKKRWSEGHEVLHSVLPWHGEYMLGDNKMTLSPMCHAQIEAEANYGTGRLLFPKHEFLGMARSQVLNMQHIREIAKHFGNTITSTLWRCVESDENPSFAVIGAHPHYGDGGESEVEHLIQSRSFCERFSNFTEKDAMDRIRSYCGYRRRGPLGSGKVVVTDDNGELHEFKCESFSNGYHTLTLGLYLRPKVSIIAIS